MRILLLPVSGSAETVDRVFALILGISIALLALITFLMVYFTVRYSRKRNPKPGNIRSNLFLEIVWLVVPTALVLAMFYSGWTGFKFIREIPEGAMLVKVTARMWSWLFEYENGKKSDVLRVPVGKNVKLAMTSNDVIHSLFIPAFRLKEDAVPGMETYLWFAAGEPGAYDIFCAEYCGVGHSAMLSKVEVMPVAEFEEWYGAKEEKGETVKAGPEEGFALIDDKGCTLCHTIDGTVEAGPSFKGIYRRKTVVMTGGKEREIVADEDYLRRSILDPKADLVKDFPDVMPEMEDLTAEELELIINYLKTLE